MASMVCLACGSPAVSGDRSVISESGQDRDITYLWKEIATIELEQWEEILDLELFSKMDVLCVENVTVHMET